MPDCPLSCPKKFPVFFLGKQILCETFCMKLWYLTHPYIDSSGYCRCITNFLQIWFKTTIIICYLWSFCGSGSGSDWWFGLGISHQLGLQKTWLELEDPLPRCFTHMPRILVVLVLSSLYESLHKVAWVSHSMAASFSKRTKWKVQSLLRSSFRNHSLSLLLCSTGYIGPSFI